jgi:ribose transport system substrate-binding protein
MLGTRLRLCLAGLTACAALAAGCGGDDGNEPGAAAGSTEENPGVAAAAAEIEKYRAVPEFQAPGTKIDAKALGNGKTLLSIPASSSIPFVQTLQNGVKKLSGELGVRFVDWPNQGKPVQWVQGMDAGVDRGADAINLMAGIPPNGLAPQIKKAQDAGISVIASHLYDVDQPADQGVDTVDVPYEQAGRLLADWVIAKTGGKANALVVKIDEVESTKPMMEGITGEFSEKCGDGCKVSTINVAIADVATRIQPQVQSALLKDPNIDYVIALYDSAEAPFVVSAIKQAGASDRVKVVTFNGTPSVLEMVASGDVEMDVGENLEWISYAVMDQSLRLMAGEEPVDDPKLPLRVFDKENVAEAGSPPKDNEGYGDAYIQGYRDLWGLEG